MAFEATPHSTRFSRKTTAAQQTTESRAGDHLPDQKPLYWFKHNNCTSASAVRKRPGAKCESNNDRTGLASKRHGKPSFEDIYLCLDFDIFTFASRCDEWPVPKQYTKGRPCVQNTRHQSLSPQIRRASCRETV